MCFSVFSSTRLKGLTVTIPGSEEGEGPSPQWPGIQLQVFLSTTLNIPDMGLGLYAN